MSAAAKLLVAQGAHSSINEAIISMYRNEVHHTFNTYNQWKEKGYQVRKGESAFLVWARPLGAHEEQEAEQINSKFFPVCFLFSNAQVDPIK